MWNCQCLLTDVRLGCLGSDWQKFDCTELHLTRLDITGLVFSLISSCCSCVIPSLKQILFLIKTETEFLGWFALGCIYVICFSPEASLLICLRDVHRLSGACGSKQMQIKCAFIFVNVGVCSCCRGFLAKAQFLFSLHCQDWFVSGFLNMVTYGNCLHVKFYSDFKSHNSTLNKIVMSPTTSLCNDKRWIRPECCVT